MILRYASTSRHRLEREIHALEHPSAALEKKLKKGKRSKRRKKPHSHRENVMPEKKRRESTLMRMKSMHLATTVMQQIRDAHAAYEEELHRTSAAADVQGRIHRAHSCSSVESEQSMASASLGDHHHHHFQHIHIVADSPLRRDSAEARAMVDRLAGDYQLHLSVPQEEAARKWFDFHAKDVATRSMAELPLAELRVTTGALVESDEDEDDDEDDGDDDGGGGDGGRISLPPPAPFPITPRDSISRSGIPSLRL